MAFHLESQKTLLQHLCHWKTLGIFTLAISTTLLHGENRFITKDGFTIPKAHQPLQFPKDHASHPDFKIEWWYLVGHLKDNANNRYTYQATFFRYAEKEASQIRQFHLAHMALLDIEKNKYIQEERLYPDGIHATAKTDKLDLKNGNWRLKMDEESGELSLSGSIKSEALFNLKLTPLKPLVRFGEEGISRKGASPSSVSYYLSWTRLKSTGTLQIAGKELRVEGISWMDHEISSKQLDDSLSGWDWTCIQLESGIELKAYQLRQKDGTISPFSQLIWIDRDNNLTYFDSTQFSWNVLKTWTSPKTGGVYPIEISLQVRPPGKKMEQTYHLIPNAEQQEIEGEQGGIDYWEGSCRVFNPAGKALGNAFLELTGYAKSLAVTDK